MLADAARETSTLTTGTTFMGREHRANDLYALCIYLYRVDFPGTTSVVSMGVVIVEPGPW